MRVSRLLCVVMLLGFVAACETSPQDDATATSTAAGGGAGGLGGRGGGGFGGAGSSPVTTGNLSPQQELARVGDRVFFDVDQFTLSPEARATVQQQAALLQRNPSITVVIEGHCDERGTREYNLALGERRANAVKDYLLALGISADRVTTVSYGEERPAAIGSDEGTWAKNRRAMTIATAGRLGS